MIPLDEIREGAEVAWRKIGYDPDKIHLLDDDDLTALALAVKSLLPLVEASLIAKAGGMDAANVAVERVKRYSQGRLIKLVRAAQSAMRRDGSATLNQHAAMFLDAHVGAQHVNAEIGRRNACRAGRMN